MITKHQTITIMKAYLIACLLWLTAASIHAAEKRNWTDSESKRQISGEIKDKKIDNSEVEIIQDNGKSVWLKTDRLIDADKEYVKNWVKPVDHLSVRVVGSGNGGKKIQVNGVAGSRKLQIVARRSPKDKNPVIKYLKPGETLEFTYDASNEYIVKAWVDDELVDQESWNKKTGL